MFLPCLFLIFRLSQWWRSLDLVTYLGLLDIASAAHDNHFRPLNQWVSHGWLSCFLKHTSIFSKGNFINGIYGSHRSDLTSLKNAVWFYLWFSYWGLPWSLHKCLLPYIINIESKRQCDTNVRDANNIPWTAQGSLLNYMGNHCKRHILPDNPKCLKHR